MRVVPRVKIIRPGISYIDVPGLFVPFFNLNIKYVSKLHAPVTIIHVWLSAYVYFFIPFFRIGTQMQLSGCEIRCVTGNTHGRNDRERRGEKLSQKVPEPEGD